MENANPQVEPQQNLKESHPAIEFVYPLALDSYEWAQKRKESSDNRTQTLLVFFAAVILIIPTLVDKRLPSAPFRSGWFIAAVAAFVLASVFGILGRFLFNITILNISKLYESSLDLPEWKFKSDMIYRAKLDFESNYRALAGKRAFTIVMTALFLLSSILVTVWIYKFTS